MILALVCTLVAPSFAAPQALPIARELRAPAPAHRVFVGRVLTADGRPARGAVIESSEGGKCTSGPDGGFELALDLPADAPCVEITAVLTRAGVDLVASTSVVPSSFAPIVSVGGIVVEPGGRPPRWLTAAGSRPGVEGWVEAFAEFDDGGGPTLYAGGAFTSAGGVSANSVARWDGEHWTAVGDGFPGSSVKALAEFDDGGGPALYAGGDLVAEHYVAKWDGSQWTALGGGTNASVHALAAFDDGNGSRLYAGGSFTSAGGVSAHGIARWDGTSWSAVGAGIDGFVEDVLALAVFDDGHGPALYAGGVLYDENSDIGIERWDGTSWSRLGSGIGRVNALAVFDAGSGAALYAGGLFTTAGGAAANSIARWDGTSWSPLGSGLSGGFPFGFGYVLALAAFDDGGGPALFAGGGFAGSGGVSTRAFARWDGSSWSAPAGGQLGFQVGPGEVRALLPFDDGHGTRLCVGGNFSSAGPLATEGVAAWEGEWSGIGGGPSDEVDALAVFDDGSGAALYAGGAFTIAGGALVNNIVRWDGSSWSGLAGGTSGRVRALAACSIGGTPALYAAGEFASAGGLLVDRIARWDGAAWSSLVAGTHAAVLALAAFDDGGGTALYAGGSFTRIGGAGDAHRIARWNGTSWSALATGTNGTVDALAVFDDGHGPALYAGGAFTSASGVAANHVARWDGSAWSALGAGTDDVVLALAAWDDGNGPALYAGGSFTSAGGASASHIARWDGASWTALGSGTNDVVNALAVADDGRGSALFAGGLFSSAGGHLARHVARWHHSSWSALGPGLAAGPVQALSAFDGGPGGDEPSLYLGGAFATSPSGDSNLARWGGGHRGVPSDSARPR